MARWICLEDGRCENEKQKRERDGRDGRDGLRHNERILGGGKEGGKMKLVGTSMREGEERWNSERGR